MSFQAQLLVDDTALPHEQKPHGVPTNYDWYQGPVIQAGNNVPATVVTNADGTTTTTPYQRMNPWGQIYTPATGNPQPGALVEIRGMQCYVLTNGAWRSLYPTGVPALTGSWYAEDFHGPIVYCHYDNTSIPGSVIAQPDNAGHLFHFYPNGSRGYVPSTPLDGVISCAWVRLHAGSYDPMGTAPQLIANVGADYWATATSGTAKGIGEGRFKTVKPWWRLFTFCTVNATNIVKQPLPTLTLDSGQEV